MLTSFRGGFVEDTKDVLIRKVPAKFIQIIDQVAEQKGCSRQQLLIEILDAYTAKERRRLALEEAKQIRERPDAPVLDLEEVIASLAASGHTFI